MLLDFIRPTRGTSAILGGSGFLGFRVERTTADQPNKVRTQLHSESIDVVPE
jgi:hypothetical protein